MKIKNILFDLDGTLADSIPVILAASRAACKDLGVIWDEEKARGLIGLPLIDTGEIVLGKGRGMEYFKAYHDHFFDEMDKGLRPFDGAPEMLRTLHEAGKKLAIVTSKKEPATLLSFKMMDMEGVFDLVVTADSGCGFKPTAEPALYAIEKLNGKKESTVFVGDSSFDICCAKNAGITAIGVAWGADSEEKLLSCGADIIVHSMEELQNLLLS